MARPQKIKYYKEEMEMAIIQVTPELLQSKATEVRGLKSNHDETMQKLNNLVHALNEQWKGEAQDAFVAKFDSKRDSKYRPSP